MKIKFIRVYEKDLGTKRPYTIAFKTVDEVKNAFVEIELENGIIGYGSGNPSEYVVGEKLSDTLRVLNGGDLAFLVDRDIREFQGILVDIQQQLPQNPAARAALDIAVYDAFTKLLDVPLASFLGHKITSLPTSVTIGIKNVQETLIEAEEYFSMGFNVLKIKTGNDVEEDIERIKKLREKSGKSVVIRVDANQGYSVEQLKYFVDQTQHDDVEFIEQPLKATWIKEMKLDVPDEIKKVIAADESLISPKDAMLLASEPKASDIFNIKLMKSGGIQPARRIASIAQDTGIDLMWGCNDESIISISAALHTALSFANTKYLDLDGSLDLLEDVVKGGFEIKEGWMSITGKPGLGVDRV